MIAAARIATEKAPPGPAACDVSGITWQSGDCVMTDNR